ncbi:MAG TPA: MATE family efflux transporter [Firmicutes bacterium]|jgi:putative MATE family efflux protein|nr:MAG: multidrug transporter MatE [Peptococcaceae bacterium 1109]HHT73953.1 MATE family efflux transporter [Bacillota bacterium]
MDRAEQLGRERVPALLLRFSIPAIIGMLVQALYNVVDRIFVGHGVGPEGIAGLTVVFPVMLVIMAFSMLIGLGATALISIRLGEGKQREAEQIVSTAALMLALIAGIISTLGLTFIDPLLRLLGASDQILPYAREYLSVIFYGTVFQSVSFGMNHFIRAEGNPRRAMSTMLIGAILNTILDPIFIFGFGWGVTGAAVATVISQVVSCIWVLSYFLSGQSVVKFRLKGIRVELPVLLKIVSIGFAPWAMQLAASLLNLILTRSLAYYGGDVAISGMGIVYSINTIFMMPIFGINQGVQPIIGYNFGAQQYDRVREALRLGIFGATGIVTLGWITTRLFPIQLISLFGRGDEQLLNVAATAMRIGLFVFPLVGFQVVGASYFQAVGKPKRAAFLSLSRQLLLLIPAMLILPRFLGLMGVFVSLPAADVGSTLLTAVLLAREMKELGPGREPALVGR